jgi:hypothetical protein
VYIWYTFSIRSTCIRCTYSERSVRVGEKRTKKQKKKERERGLRGNKRRNHSTQDSRVVPHRGTNWAALWLTAQIGRDAVLSESYGRGYHSPLWASFDPTDPVDFSSFVRSFVRSSTSFCQHHGHIHIHIHLHLHIHFHIHFHFHYRLPDFDPDFGFQLCFTCPARPGEINQDSHRAKGSVRPALKREHVKERKRKRKREEESVQLVLNKSLEQGLNLSGS